MRLNSNSFEGRMQAAARPRTILSRDYGTYQRMANKAKRAGLHARHVAGSANRWFVESYSHPDQLHPVTIELVDGQIMASCDCDGFNFVGHCMHVGCVLSAAQLGPFAPDPLACTHEPSDAEMFAVDHGRLIYQLCPCCGHRLVRIWSPRNHSHEYRSNCPRCNWRCWEREHEADMMRRANCTQREIDQVVRSLQRAEDRAAIDSWKGVAA